ncbi:MAG: hypothetical protein V4724_12115 [Pseudomonadota bacterium]
MTDYNEEQLFVWRTMRADEAADIYALHRGVFEKTPAGMVRPDDLDHFESHVDALGRILGCFADGDLVAYGVLGMDSHTVDHLAELLGASAADRARMCVLDGAASLPEWRGRSLHCVAIEERMALGSSLGRTLVAATVAPENMRSLRGLLKEGFTVRRYAVVYGGLVRLIVQNDLAQQPPPVWRKRQHIASGDRAGHQRALSEGLVGYACWTDEAHQWYVDYGDTGSQDEPV